LWPSLNVLLLGVEGRALCQLVAISLCPIAGRGGLCIESACGHLILSYCWAWWAELCVCLWPSLNVLLLGVEGCALSQFVAFSLCPLAGRGGSSIVSSFGCIRLSRFGWPITFIAWWAGALQSLYQGERYFKTRVKKQNKNARLAF